MCTSTLSAEGYFCEVAQLRSAKTEVFLLASEGQRPGSEEPLIVWPPGAGSGSTGRGKVPFEAHGAKSFPVTMETGTVGSQPENQGEQR